LRKQLTIDIIVLTAIKVNKFLPLLPAWHGGCLQESPWDIKAKEAGVSKSQPLADDRHSRLHVPCGSGVYQAPLHQKLPLFFFVRQFFFANQWRRSLEPTTKIRLVILFFSSVFRAGVTFPSGRYLCGGPSRTFVRAHVTPARKTQAG
jgi:hypothetical protein